MPCRFTLAIFLGRLAKSMPENVALSIRQRHMRRNVA
nr:MAG TPA: hypothetical protein [Caudoviricetes sp.]